MHSRFSKTRWFTYMGTHVSGFQPRGAEIAALAPASAAGTVERWVWVRCDRRCGAGADGVKRPRWKRRTVAPCSSRGIPPAWR